ncbi:MAG: hypothetical protein AB4426_15360 [Xenococcaceae cyanobacterium]
MPPTQTNTSVKVLSPTLHLYHYVLRNGINERPETLETRREFWFFRSYCAKNEQKILKALLGKGFTSSIELKTIFLAQ